MKAPGAPTLSRRNRSMNEGQAILVTSCLTAQDDWLVYVTDR